MMYSPKVTKALMRSHYQFKKFFGVPKSTFREKLRESMLPDRQFPVGIEIVTTRGIPAQGNYSPIDLAK
jgi:hypothetical protein